MSWSLILKTLHPQVPGDEPSAWNYYKREADAYQSGRLDDRTGQACPRQAPVLNKVTGTLTLT